MSAAYRRAAQSSAIELNSLEPYSNNDGLDGGAPSPYGFSAGTGTYDPAPARKKRSKWLLIGVPVLIICIVAAVLGGVFGSRAANDGSHSASSSGGNRNAQSGSKATSSAKAAGSSADGSAATNANELARFATGTDTYLLPVYPTTTNSALMGPPTTSARAGYQWPSDPSPPSKDSPRDHPRIIAPSYKWEALPDLIKHDAYYASWNATIFANASTNYDEPLPEYIIDGGLSGSGILDVAMRVKMRIKNWGYAWQMSNDTKWVDRAWNELETAMNKNPNITFGNETTGIWNPVHFLDVGEMTAAFGIAYDWFHDGFNDTQKEILREAIVDNGLNYCLGALDQTADYGTRWWLTATGNWNCVCNGGCTIGALAILGEDTTGVAEKVLDLAVPNAKNNCAQAVTEDGSWRETSDYWYFGTTSFSELSSALTTAWGDDQGMLTANPASNLTALFHMYVMGMTSKFNYGDHGPNKYAATANGLLFLGGVYGIPTYSLFQRDQIDASEPWSMFWYDPSTVGAFWDGLALDHHFPTGSDDWMSMRTSWTDNNGAYVAMKAGNMQGHQTHGDIDAGDFVLDALGQRWAGELGSGNYLSTGYFSSEAETSQRWLYYRKRTEGQNCLVLNYLNQNVTSQPTTKFDSTGDLQGASTVMTLDDGSTAYYTMDLTEAYNGTSISRGIRFINNRKQVLIQDDITAPDAENIQWRMHTNATVNISDDGATATLTLAGKTMTVHIASPTTGAVFTTLPASRYDSDPPLPTQPVGEDGDQPNPGVTVLAINLAGGTYSLQVVFNPAWEGMSTGDFVEPESVALGDWSLTSHK